MTATTKGKPSGQVTRLQKSLERAKAKNAALGKSLAEAHEREKATADILRVISRSPTDSQLVFDGIAKAALRLFGGVSAAVTLVVGDTLHLAAFTSTSKAGDKRLASQFPCPVSKLPGHARAIKSRLPYYFIDTEKVARGIREVARARGYRSAVFVPLLREKVAIGTIGISRGDPGAFSDHEIELLKTFADQAVIASENARLFNETKEALEQQTATANILRVISSSPTDLQPVFDAILENATRLCDAHLATLGLYDGEKFEYVAQRGGGRELTERLFGLGRFIPTPETNLWRMIFQQHPIHVRDLMTNEQVRSPVPVMFNQGARSLVAVPMLKEGRVVGGINIYRPEVRPFSQNQIDLVSTFANQAVIAIENVRLFKDLEARNAELTESLEQQTATSEILRIISRSPTDIQPVLDAVAASAARLCNTEDVYIRRIDADTTRIVAHVGKTPLDAEGNVRPLKLRTIVGTLARERKTIHIADVSDPHIGEKYPDSLTLAGRWGVRTLLYVPLLRDGVAIGVIAMRRREVRPFSDKQIKLLETFADQAVIAIENVRLFKELEARNAELSESLEQQTATTEILRVISSSPTDVQPVFDAIAESAARLCSARDSAIRIVDGDTARIAAHFGSIPHADRSAAGLPILRGSFSGRAILERRTIHIPDTNDEQVEFDYPETIRRRPGDRFRTTLIVPLLRVDTAIGTIDIRRQEAQPFSDKQIELLQTFAAQAVIAIENVRLFKELQARNAEVTEALEQQTATAEILQVISSSPTDLQPVFDAILDKATQLCDSNLGVLGLYDGENYQCIAARAGNAEVEKWALDRGSYRPNAGSSYLSKVLFDGQPMQAADLRESPGYRNRRPMQTQLVEVVGVRTHLAVPMLKDGRAVGSIGIYRPEVRPFTQKQIDLVSTFANQAVIAIENVRLFKELQAQTEALSRSVNQLTALGEVGQAISSTLDLETVLQTIVSHAMRLTGLDAGVIHEYDDSSGQLLLRASESFDDESVALMRGAGLRKGEGAVGISVATGEPTQVPDTHAADYPVRLRALLDGAGFRAILAVPLVREEQVVGALMMLRRTPGAFAPEIVDLLKTFATQSALAIQNARLFREIAEKGRQLEVASQHKSQFLASMSHELRTPLNAMLGFNEMILGEIYGPVPADIQSPLADIQSSGKHLLRLINNVLDLAKIEAGRMELSLTDYSVHDIVERVRSTLHPLAADKGLEFTVSVSEDIPFAYGDFGRISQCLMNLAGNSLKFTRQGHVQITVDRKGDLLVYRVADTGIGIPPEKIDSLFTEFKQTDATIASEFGGTGLGLSITKKFVEIHGGRIWVESELGQGSEFIFEIPLRAAEVKS